jgi:hypothetical protein
MELNAKHILSKFLAVLYAAFSCSGWGRQLQDVKGNCHTLKN